MEAVILEALKEARDTRDRVMAMETTLGDLVPIVTELHRLALRDQGAQSVSSRLLRVTGHVLSGVTGAAFTAFGVPALAALLPMLHGPR